MHFSRYESADNPEVWYGLVNLPVGRDIKFRYFVCMLLDLPPVNGISDPSIGRVSVVRRWESPIQPRVIRQLKFNGGYPLTFFIEKELKS